MRSITVGQLFTKLAEKKPPAFTTLHLVKELTKLGDCNDRLKNLTQPYRNIMGKGLSACHINTNAEFANIYHAQYQLLIASNLSLDATMLNQIKYQSEYHSEIKEAIDELLGANPQNTQNAKNAKNAGASSSNYQAPPRQEAPQGSRRAASSASTSAAQTNAEQPAYTCEEVAGFVNQNKAKFNELLPTYQKIITALNQTRPNKPLPQISIESLMRCESLKVLKSMITKNFLFAFHPDKPNNQKIFNQVQLSEFTKKINNLKDALDEYEFQERHLPQAAAQQAPHRPAAQAYQPYTPPRPSPPQPQPYYTPPHAKPAAPEQHAYKVPNYDQNWRVRLDKSKLKSINNPLDIILNKCREYKNKFRLFPNQQHKQLIDAVESLCDRTEIPEKCKGWNFCDQYIRQKSGQSLHETWVAKTQEMLNKLSKKLGMPEGRLWEYCCLRERESFFSKEEREMPKDLIACAIFETFEEMGLSYHHPLEPHVNNPGYIINAAKNFSDDILKKGDNFSGLRDILMKNILMDILEKEGL